MAFILDTVNLKGIPDFDYIRRQYDQYYQYLESIKTALPPSAYDFAVASWHYDFRDHRSPHDAWLEQLRITEVPMSPLSEMRSIELTVQLLGAYHDGYIELLYTGVRSYSLIHTGGSRKHGDWLIDEIRLSDQNLVLHEVVFHHGARWAIECEDLHYSWKPFDVGTPLL